MLLIINTVQRDAKSGSGDRISGVGDEHGEAGIADYVQRREEAVAQEQVPVGAGLDDLGGSEALELGGLEFAVVRGRFLLQPSGM